MNSERPYLSIVLTGRNDNYGGDFLKRLQDCIEWNARLLEHFNVSTEFVFVNWNPIEENLPLAKELNWPDRNGVSFRIIDVPKHIHDEHVDDTIRDTVPLFEFIAKNAGIRRALGEYILCINADILIHPEIIEQIATIGLEKKQYYRANRLDFKTVQTLNLENLWQAGFALSLKGFRYKFLRGISIPTQYRWLTKLNSSRLSWEAWKLRHHKIADLFHLNVVYNNGAYMAHCYGSGDFMLMHKNGWQLLKGYPEYTRISTHTDAMFTVLASTEFEEVVFEEPVFHQEHLRRYTWEAIEAKDGFDATYQQFENLAREVRLQNATHSFLNDETWGLVNFDLSEMKL